MSPVLERSGLNEVDGLSAKWPSRRDRAQDSLQILIYHPTTPSRSGKTGVISFCPSRRNQTWAVRPRRVVLKKPQVPRKAQPTELSDPVEEAGQMPFPYSDLPA